MKISNFYGMSYHFTPVVLDNVNSDSPLVNTTDTNGNKILFFDGSMPDDDTLYNIKSETELRAAYTPIMEITDLNFVFTYSNGNKKRLIKKMPVDAIETTFTADGTIGWAAIILTNDLENKDVILFTDSIGQWGDDDMPIIIDKYTGTVGEKNVFKDFSLILRDSSSNEA